MDTKETAPTPPELIGTYPVRQQAALSVEEPIAWYLHHAAAATDRAGVKSVRSEARAAYMRRFGERCKLARGSKEIAEVAATVGVHRNTIWNIERGDSLPDAFELEVLAREYNTTPTHLLEGEPHAHAQLIARVVSGVRAVEADGFVHVPLFDIKGSTGKAAFDDVSSVLAMQPFDAGFIRQGLNIEHNDIALSAMVGVSMEPWLHARDTLLTDRRDTQVLNEGIHIVGLDGALLVKKLQRLPGKVLRVSSHNPAYEPFDIHDMESSSRDFAVIGRVRWAGITFS